MNVPTAEKLANQVAALTPLVVTQAEKDHAARRVCVWAGCGLDVTDKQQRRAAAELARPVLEALGLVERRRPPRQDTGRIELPPGRSHATKSAYNYGCRCPSCTRAAVNAVTARRLVNAEKLRLGQVDPPHGTQSTYSNYVCRCQPCVEANRAAVAYSREARRKAGLR